MPSQLYEFHPQKMPGFRDNRHRLINYLRLSVTDRCNMRCIYCMPEQDVPFIDHKDILTYEEMLHLVSLCVSHGIRKVRLTGGEPLVRKGIIPFIKKLCRIEGLEAVTLTTNGVVLKEYARQLVECGICGVNVSLDSLQPKRFRRITRLDYFHRVWEGMETAAAVGLKPIKINVVAMRGINEDEILDFARLTYANLYHVRLIEMMPVGERTIWSWSADKFLSIDDIQQTIRSLGPIRSVDSGPFDGPAARFALEGAKGEIGLIGALSNYFCDKCNRLRLTADGYLRGCLFSDQEIDIKTPLRQEKGDDHLLTLIAQAILTSVHPRL